MSHIFICRLHKIYKINSKYAKEFVQLYNAKVRNFLCSYLKRVNL